MMRLTILICVLVAALLGSAWGGYALRGREVDKLKQAHAEQFAKAQADAARAAGRITKTIQEAQDAEHIRRIDAEAAARRAAAATVGLRDELAATRAAVEALDWQLASSRKTAAATVAVLTDLLGQCSERRRELAQYADAAAAAGRVCERTANAMTQELK